MTDRRPTVYETLMSEVYARFRGGQTLYGTDLGQVIARDVPSSAHGRVEDALRNAINGAYRAGVEHGYHQAAQEFDARRSNGTI